MYKPCTWAASESEFDHANRNPCLKSSHASSDSAKIIKMSRLAIDRLLILWSLQESLRCCEADAKQTAQLFCPWTRKILRENNSDSSKTAPETAPETPVVCNFAYLSA